MLDPTYNLGKVLATVDRGYDKELKERTNAVVDPAVEELAFHTKRLTGHVDHVYFNRSGGGELGAV